MRTIDRRTLLKQAALGLVAGSTMTASSVASGATPRSSVDVAIIGAGLSGLTAARDLKKAGLDNFIILEARDRVGGRTLNADIGGGHVFEMGGQWLGSFQTAVLDLMHELGLATFPSYNQGNTAIVSGSEVVLVNAAEIVDSTLASALDALARDIPLDAPWTHPRAAEFDAMTFADWLATRNIPADQAWSVRSGTLLTFGAPPEALSLLWVLFYVRSSGSYADLEGAAGQGAQALRVVGGSQMISLRMAESLAAHLRLAAPVHRIRGWQDEGPCVLECATGSVTARRVILALSPSQAQTIEFSPALPAQRAMLQQQWPGTAYALKTAMVYEKPFWRAAGLSGQSLTTETDDAYLFAWDNSPDDASLGVIASFVDPRTNAQISAAARRAALQTAYARWLGPSAETPIGYHQQYWAGETYTRGCVSPVPPGVLTRCGAALRVSSGVLEWAGSETALLSNGYMDGAVRAGHDAALRTLRAI
jgi:monoamine oxidase